MFVTNKLDLLKNVCMDSINNAVLLKVKNNDRNYFHSNSADGLLVLQMCYIRKDHCG